MAKQVQTLGFSTGERITAYAEVDMAGKRFHTVQLAGQLVRPSLAGEKPFGILQNAPAEGKPAVVITHGGSEAVLGATVVQHSTLGPDADGALVPLATGRIVALEPGDAGDTINVHLGESPPTGGTSVSSGLLTATDSVVGRVEGDRHTVTSGPMVGAEFELQGAAWGYIGQTVATIEADSTSGNWPISDADIATITAKMSAGQSYRFNVEDTVNKKYGAVELRQNGILRFQLLSTTPVSSEPGGVNPAEVISGTGLGAAKTLDCQNGKQVLFRINGEIPQQTTFTIANLPDQDVAVVVFEAEQGVAAPVFANVAKLNADPLYNTRTVVTIMNTSGTLNMIANAQQS